MTHCRWDLLAWLVSGFLLLGPITRWFGSRIQGLVFLLTHNRIAAVYVHFVLLLPGTLVHELSHLLAARVLGVKTGKLSLRPKMQGRGAVQFGAVQLGRTDALRESLIGLAPLLVGSGLILALTSSRLKVDPLQILSLRRLPTYLAKVRQSQDAGLWIYLLMAISNAMLPSASDRRAWRPIGIYLGAIFVALCLARLLPRVPPKAVVWSWHLVTGLAFAFTLTIGLDLVIGGLLWALEAIFGRLLARALRAA